MIYSESYYFAPKGHFISDTFFGEVIYFPTHHSLMQTIPFGLFQPKKTGRRDTWNGNRPLWMWSIPPNACLSEQSKTSQFIGFINNVHHSPLVVDWANEGGHVNNKGGVQRSAFPSPMSLIVGRDSGWFPKSEDT